MLDTVLSAIKSREGKTFIEKLYYEYESQMYSAAFAILRHKQDAEDAVQSAFLKNIEHLPELNLDFDLKTRSLLTIITKNIALNQIKKRKQRLKYEVDIEDYEMISVNEDFDKVSFKEIQSLLAVLPDDLKHVIILRFVHDFSPEIIAGLLNITESAVYKRITAARKLLNSAKEKML